MGRRSGILSEEFDALSITRLVSSVARSVDQLYAGLRGSSHESLVDT